MLARWRGRKRCWRSYAISLLRPSGTCSPSLNVAAYATGAFDGGGYARDSLLPVIRRRMRERHQFEVFDYGNFRGNEEGATIAGTPGAWETYEHFPRYGTNYYALRGR